MSENPQTQSPARYNARAAEEKWQQIWAQRQVFATPPANGKPDYFVLEMFPYPSGNIHMGHVRNYTLGDVTARFRRARGYNVLYPMGWDAFGLPAENAAIERGVHPGVWTRQNIATMRGQLQSMGLSYDWSRELATCEPEYYRHEQRFFLEMLRRGIAYRREAVVNWDPVDHTVLANEQVVDGRGWRSGAPVERRTLSQWFLKITDYAEPLLAGLETLTHWPEKVRIMQERWIGKSSGALVTLEIVASHPSSVTSQKIEIYTTRPDTFYGMSFVAIAPEHPLVKELATGAAPLAAFLQECSALGTSEEAIEKAEKKGYDTGLQARNPFSGERVPIYIANFVLMGYGTGAVFGCPAHDARDHEFAVKYGLPIRPVVSPEGDAPGAELLLPYTGDGVMRNSPPADAPRASSDAPVTLNGLPTSEAKEKAIAALENMGVGRRQTNYRLRDWGISRQRYWGCPIPMIRCHDCGDVPVPDSQLPVTLPQAVAFDIPGNPLAHHPTWKHVPCPACGKPAERETDTFDTFFESSWYFASFASGGSGAGITAEAARWLPVAQYIGGIEHAVLHLLYARFFTRVLKDCGILPIEEPFAGLMTQGMVGHATFKNAATGEWVYPADVHKDDRGQWRLASGELVQEGRSEKMSKSKKNVVDPRAIIDAYGADTARLFMMSDSPPERGLEWTEAGIDGAWRYVQRIYRLAQDAAQYPPVEAAEDNALELRRLTHRTIAAVTKDIEQFHFNKAVARIRELSNAIEKAPPGPQARAATEAVLQLLAPFMPHLAEECWATLGHETLIAQCAWPQADPAMLTQETVTVAVQVNGKLRATLELARDLPQEEAAAAALAQPSVQQAIAGKSLRKTIVVPNRIINLVAA